MSLAGLDLRVPGENESVSLAGVRNRGWIMPDMFGIVEPAGIGAGPGVNPGVRRGVRRLSKPGYGELSCLIFGADVSDGSCGASDSEASSDLTASSLFAFASFFNFETRDLG